MCVGDDDVAEGFEGEELEVFSAVGVVVGGWVCVCLAIYSGALRQKTDKGREE